MSDDLDLIEQFALAELRDIDPTEFEKATRGRRVPPSGSKPPPRPQPKGPRKAPLGTKVVREFREYLNSEGLKPKQTARILRRMRNTYRQTGKLKIPKRAQQTVRQASTKKEWQGMRDNLRGRWRARRKYNTRSVRKAATDEEMLARLHDNSISDEDFFDDFADHMDGDDDFWGHLTETVNAVVQKDRVEKARIDAIIAKRVVQEGDEWCVRSEEGKSLGCYKSKEEAVERLRQVEWHKTHKAAGPYDPYAQGQMQQGQQMQADPAMQQQESRYRDSTMTPELLSNLMWSGQIEPAKLAQMLHNSAVTVEMVVQAAETIGLQLGPEDVAELRQAARGEGIMPADVLEAMAEEGEQKELDPEEAEEAEEVLAKAVAQVDQNQVAQYQQPQQRSASFDSNAHSEDPYAPHEDEVNSLFEAMRSGKAIPFSTKLAKPRAYNAARARVTETESRTGNWVRREETTKGHERPFGEGTPVLKAEGERRFTLGPFYVPDKNDAHNEWVSGEDLREGIWKYMRKGKRDVFLQHTRERAGEYVELMSWPYEHEVELWHPGMAKDRSDVKKATMPANTAYMGVIWEPWAWERVKKGELRGLSMGGSAQRVEAEFIAKHSDHDQEDHGNWARGGATTRDADAASALAAAIPGVSVGSGEEAPNFGTPRPVAQGFGGSEHGTDLDPVEAVSFLTEDLSAAGFTSRGDGEFTNDFGERIAVKTSGLYTIVTQYNEAGNAIASDKFSTWEGLQEADISTRLFIDSSMRNEMALTKASPWARIRAALGEVLAGGSPFD